MRILFIPSIYLEIGAELPICQLLEKYFEGRVRVDLFPFPNPCYTLDLSSRSTTLPSLEEALKHLETVDKNYDWIVGYGFGSMFWTVLSRLAGWTTPAIINPGVNPQSKRNILLTLLWCAHWHPLDRAVVGSEATRNLFLSMGVPHVDKQHLFGIDGRYFYKLDAPRSELLAELGLEESIYLIHVGLPESAEDLESLASIFLCVSILIKDCRLLILSREAEKSDFGTFSKWFSESENVRVVSCTSPQEFNTYYNIASLLISTTIDPSETFGHSVVEAMASGLVPIVPAYGGFRDIVPENCGTLISKVSGSDGWFHVNDLEFIRKIYEILSNSEQLSVLSDAVEKRGQDYYHTTAFAYLSSFLFQERSGAVLDRNPIVRTQHLPFYLYLMLENWDGYPTLTAVEFLLTTESFINFTMEETKLYYRNAFKDF